MYQGFTKAIDFEPVNAEGWLPTGNESWSRIQEEINSSHIFVLILGERYGWIPQEGAGAAEGRSVIHMELIKAREFGLPILPFIKKLSYDSDRDSEDAKRRDALRKEVTDWASGRFVAEFDLAYDLAIKVGASVVGVLANSYLRSDVQRRAMVTRLYEDRLQPDKRATTISIPHQLVQQVIDQKVILVAGAGVSLAAGYPSERALSEYLASQLFNIDDLPESLISGIPFPMMAQLAINYMGRQSLINCLQEVMSGVRGVEPTQAHIQGVKLFKKIFITNFDGLFEMACRKQNMEFEVIESGKVIPDNASSVSLVKLCGTITNRDSLLLTERDVWEAFNERPSFHVGRLFDVSVLKLLRLCPALIIASTSVNIYLDWIINNLHKDYAYFIVVPSLNRFNRHYYGSRLDVIEASPDNFLSALANEVGPVSINHP